ncbi:MAG: hypothetical protein ABR521_08240 [Gaiellaceae bacterium]
MGAAAGIAGSLEPEAAGIFLADGLDEAEWFCGFAGGTAVDVWEVDARDLPIEESSDGFLLCTAAIAPERVTLIEMRPPGVSAAESFPPSERAPPVSELAETGPGRPIAGSSILVLGHLDPDDAEVAGTNSPLLRLASAKEAFDRGELTQGQFAAATREFMESDLGRQLAAHRSSTTGQAFAQFAEEGSWPETRRELRQAPEQAERFDTAPSDPEVT